MDLEKEILEIKERNTRVAADKAWEGSWTRVCSIVALIYAIAATFLYMIDVPNFYLAALLPPAGFTLSTLSLPILKEWWIKRYDKQAK